MMTKKIRGKLRPITTTSIEVKVPITTLRRWDPFIQPHRIGPLRTRFYDDGCVERILALVELNNKARAKRTAVQLALQA